MGVFNRKGTVRDGLVLELDAANQKSWGADQTKWKDTTSQGNDGTLTNGPVHSQGPFPGAGYVDFDGSSDYLHAANSSDFDFGSGDFTLEMWILCRDTTTAVPFTKRNNISTYAPILPITTNLFTIYMSSNGSSWDIASAVDIGTITVNKWHHVAIVRNANIITGYFDGVGTQIANTSSAVTTNNHNFYIGGDASASHLNGSISNFRIVKGTALSTSNFTPQVSELTAVSNTKLLTCQKGTITDASVSGHSITVTGNAAAVYNDVSYFDLDGTDQYVRASGDLFNPNANFTFSSWVNTDVTASTTIISDHVTSGSIQIRFVNDSTLQVVDNYVVVVGTFTNFTYSPGTWYNIVVTRLSNTYSLYVNGEYKSQFTSSNSYTHGAQTIGANNTISELWNGKIGYISCYDRSLSSAEVKQNFNSLRARFGI